MGGIRMYTGAKSSVSINYKADMQKSDALLGVRGIKALAPGKLGVEGSIDVEVYPATTAILFYLALGKASLESGDEYTKIVPISLLEDLPSATIQVDHSGQKFHYVGVKVNQLTFSGSVGAIPKVSKVERLKEQS